MSSSSEETNKLPPWEPLSSADYMVVGIVFTFQAIAVIVCLHLIWYRKWPPYVTKSVNLVVIATLSGVLWTFGMANTNGFLLRKPGDILAACDFERFLSWSTLCVHMMAFFVRVYRMWRILIKHDDKMWPTEYQVLFTSSVGLIPVLSTWIIPETGDFIESANTCSTTTASYTVTLGMNFIGFLAIVFIWFVCARQLKWVRKQFNEYEAMKRTLLYITILLFSYFVVVLISLKNDLLTQRRVALIYPLMSTYILLWGSIREPLSMKMIGNKDYLLSYTKGFAELPSPAQLKASLEEQLSVDQLRTEFRSFIKTKVAQELVDFYLDSLNREEVVGFFERQAVTMRIVDRYIKEGSPDQVNISEECRERVLETDVTAYDIFDAPRTEVLDVMETNFRQDFQTTEGFRRIADASKVEQEEISLLRAGGMLAETLPSPMTDPSTSDAAPPNPKPQILRFLLPSSYSNAPKSHAVVKRPPAAHPHPEGGGAVGAGIATAAVDFSGDGIDGKTYHLFKSTNVSSSLTAGSYTAGILSGNGKVSAPLLSDNAAFAASSTAAASYTYPSEGPFFYSSSLKQSSTLGVPNSSSTIRNDVYHAAQARSDSDNSNSNNGTNKDSTNNTNNNISSSDTDFNKRNSNGSNSDSDSNSSSNGLQKKTKNNFGNRDDVKKKTINKFSDSNNVMNRSSKLVYQERVVALGVALGSPPLAPVHGYTGSAAAAAAAAGAGAAVKDFAPYARYSGDRSDRIAGGLGQQTDSRLPSVFATTGENRVERGPTGGTPTSGSRDPSSCVGAGDRVSAAWGAVTEVRVKPASGTNSVVGDGGTAVAWGEVSGRRGLLTTHGMSEGAVWNRRSSEHGICGGAPGGKGVVNVQEVKSAGDTGATGATGSATVSGDGDYSIGIMNSDLNFWQPSSSTSGSRSLSTDSLRGLSYISCAQGGHNNNSNRHKKNKHVGDNGELVVAEDSGAKRDKSIPAGVIRKEKGAFWGDLCRPAGAPHVDVFWETLWEEFEERRRISASGGHSFLPPSPSSPSPRPTGAVPRATNTYANKIGLKKRHNPVRRTRDGAQEVAEARNSTGARAVRQVLGAEGDGHDGIYAPPWSLTDPRTLGIKKRFGASGYCGGSRTCSSPGLEKLQGATCTADLEHYCINPAGKETRSGAEEKPARGRTEEGEIGTHSEAPGKKSNADVKRASFGAEHRFGRGGLEEGGIGVTWQTVGGSGGLDDLSPPASSVGSPNWVRFSDWIASAKTEQDLGEKRRLGSEVPRGRVGGGGGRDSNIRNDAEGGAFCSSGSSAGSSWSYSMSDRDGSP